MALPPLPKNTPACKKAYGELERSERQLTAATRKGIKGHAQESFEIEAKKLGTVQVKVEAEKIRKDAAALTSGGSFYLSGELQRSPELDKKVKAAAEACTTGDPDETNNKIDQLNQSLQDAVGNIVVNQRNWTR